MPPAQPAPGDDTAKGKLTPKQRLFVAEYVIDRNGVQAYFRAFGRNKSNGNPRSYMAASDSSRKLLENPLIVKELAAAEAEYVARTRISRLRVLKELALIAFADPVDAFDPDPSGGQDIPRPMSKIPAHTRRAIGAAKTKRRRIVGEGEELYEVEEVAYTFANKLAALDSLCKKLGLFKESDGSDKATPLTPAEQLKLLAKLYEEAEAEKAQTQEGDN